MQQIKNFKNHLLIAMPSLQDKYFSRSVTFICEHTSEGAMGIVINQPSTMTLEELVTQTDKDAVIDDANRTKTILCGGPVSQDRGFILHSTQEGWSSSLLMSSDIMITTSKDILSVIGNENAPSKSLVALGYAGWEAGQLEQELCTNAWLTTEATSELLFDVPMHLKWQTALNQLGVELWQLSPEAGHA